jgi:hypothetical protein
MGPSDRRWRSGLVGILFVPPRQQILVYIRFTADIALGVGDSEFASYQLASMNARATHPRGLRSSSKRGKRRGAVKK